jgi:prolyl 4-hydroxylase
MGTRKVPFCFVPQNTISLSIHSELPLQIDDVEVGGATVFPLAEARVPVRKGSAVFWSNFFVNGTADHRTFHAGCPTVIGSKWGE